MYLQSPQLVSPAALNGHLKKHILARTTDFHAQMTELKTTRKWLFLAESTFSVITFEAGQKADCQSTIYYDSSSRAQNVRKNPLRRYSKNRISHQVAT
jgi:hypothetical protein